DAGEHDVAGRPDADLGDRGVLDVAARVAIGEQLDALVGRAAQADGEALARDIAAVDQHVEAREHVGATGQLADLLDRVAGEREGRQAEGAGGVEQGARGLGLLQRLAAAERQALDAGGGGGGQLADERVDRYGAPAGGVVGGRVEAARAAEGAALEPDDEPCARAVGAAARLDGVDPRDDRRGRRHLSGLGSSGAGRSPADEPPRSISLSRRSGVTMPLSMPAEGTKPSSVPPVRRSWSWLSLAARKLYTVSSFETPSRSFHARIGTSASWTPRTSS